MNHHPVSFHVHPRFAGRLLATGLVAMSMLAVSIGARADAPDAPSNAELYRMIQELKANQDALRDEAKRARAEAEAARTELADAKRELAAIKQAPAARGGIVEARDPAFFARIENTFVSYGQEGGVSDVVGNNVNFSNDYTPRIELGYVGREGMGIRARYWSYDDSANATGGTGRVNVDTDSFDLEVFQHWQMTQTTEVEGAIGLRHLDFNQDTLDTGSGNTYSGDFNGWGVTAALQAKRKLGIGKLYGRGRLSALVGDHQIRIRNSAGTVLASSDANDNPVSQLELALGYEIARDFTWGKLNANLGYEWQQWSNLGLGDSIFGGIGNDDVLENVGFRGFVLGVGAEF